MASLLLFCRYLYIILRIKICNLNIVVQQKLNFSTIKALFTVARILIGFLTDLKGKQLLLVRDYIAKTPLKIVLFGVYERCRAHYILQSAIH